MVGFIEQLERIENSTIRESISYIASIFEKYITPEIRFNEELLSEIKERTDNDELKNNIDIIEKQSRGDSNDVINSLILSLKQNRNQYVQMDNNIEFNKRSIKVKKLLYSYVNVSRSLLSYDDYNNLIKNAPSNKKVLLIIGTVDPSEDTIMVIDEIDNILKKDNLKNLYTIIPIYGCNTDQFQKFLERFEIEIVHLAGHGKKENGEYVVNFVDKNLTYPTIKKHIGMGKDLVFFNVCRSFELVYSKGSCGQFMIVHHGDLNCVVALNFSSLFYEKLAMSQDIKQSFKDTKGNISYACGYDLI